MLYRTPNPHGGDLYTRPVRLDFSANINPYGTPEAVKAAVRNCVDELCHYPDPNCRELITAIAAYEQVPADAILCGNGAAELIYAYAFGRRPARALVTAPSFCEYSDALTAAGCRVERYLLHPETQFDIDEKFCDFLETWQGQSVFLCSPNNPTGRLIPPEILRRVGDICRKKGLDLFLDETFLDLTDGGVSGKALLDSLPGLVILKAFTKSYGMAGLRLGYCLSSPEVLSAMAAVSQVWNVSIPAQRAGIAALKCGDFRARAKDTIRVQRSLLIRELERLGLTVIPGQANYLLFFSKAELKAPLLERGIQIRDCANYPGLGSGWYRIAVKLPEENRILLEEMEKILRPDAYQDRIVPKFP